METPYITVILSLLFFTGFIKIATVLSIFRYGIGLGGMGFGVVVLGLSIALSFVSVESSVPNGTGVEAILSSKDITAQQKTFRPFLL